MRACAGCSVFGRLWIAVIIAASAIWAPLAWATGAEVGQVTFMVGVAQQVRDGASKPLKRGDMVGVGSVLQTAANGHLHVRFVDGALVSLRPSSTLKISDYQFSKDAPGLSRVKFELEEGTARAITGAAGKSAKENFRLNTPTAALGVRGTDFSVFSSLRESLVSVNSGAVVVSQFGDGCSRAGFGPCAGPMSLELKAGSRTGPAALVSATLDRPVALPEGTVKLVAGVTASPMLPPVERTSNNSSAAEQALVAETLALQGAQQTLGTSSEIKLPTAGAESSRLAWGRWYGAAWPSDQTLTYLEAMEGRRVTVGNTYLSLYRSPESPFVLPDKGSARLALQSGQVHWIGVLTREPGQIDSGSLTINFAEKRFATELSGTHPRVGVFSMQASGTLSTSPLAPGIFVSDSSATGARVAGAVTSNATEAGYFFEQPASRSILMGTTNWRR